MAKSPDAFRTISEVADWLGVQAHVLRFWESKFAQVKPIKRAGGRRYYRPADMLLLGGLKQLLHEDGLTIKGAQKLLREKGVAHVADLSQPLDDLTIAVIEGNAEDLEDTALPDLEPPTPEPAVEEIDAELVASVDPIDAPENEPEVLPVLEEAPAEVDPVVDAAPTLDATTPEDTPDEPEPPAVDEVLANDGMPEDAPSEPIEVAEAEPALAEEPPAEGVPSFRARARTPEPEITTEPQDIDPVENEPAEETAAEQVAPEELPEEEDTGPFSVTPPTAQPDAAPAKPRVIDVGPLPELIDFSAQPSALSYLASTRSVTADQAEALRPLLARLTRLRASMASPRKDIRKD